MPHHLTRRDLLRLTAVTGPGAVTVPALTGAASAAPGDRTGGAATSP